MQLCEFKNIFKQMKSGRNFISIYICIRNTMNEFYLVVLELVHNMSSVVKIYKLMIMFIEN